MKISYIQNDNLSSTETRLSYNLMDKFKERGIEILLNSCSDDCDFILSMNGLSQANSIKEATHVFPNIKSISYVWDLYPWTEYAVDHDYIQNLTELWVPSHEVKLRLNQIYKIDYSKIQVIKTYVEFFEDENNELTNNGFIFHPVRDLPFDPNYKFCQNICENLDIPYVGSGNKDSDESKPSFEQYKTNVLTCAFLTTEYMEASTGGLTLLEGYYHGKNVLVSDSKYMGADDYFGYRAYYYKDGDIEDYKNKIQMLLEKSKEPVTDLEDRKKFCEQYRIDNMVNQIINRLNQLKNA